MAVEVTAGKLFEARTPTLLFQAPVVDTIIDTWDVDSRGNRFLLPTPAAEDSLPSFTVILNWTSLLKK